MIALLKALAEALKEPLVALGRWLNPDRKREAIKDRAIKAVQELLDIKDEMILRSNSVFKDSRNKSKYALFKDHRLLKYEAHYKRQFINWRDGVA